MNDDELPGCGCLGILLAAGAAVLLAANLLGCERIVYVYQDAPGADAPMSDAELTADAGSDTPDEAGVCDPDRTPGTISHADCRGLATPVCDAITERCVRPPVALCGACETDAQCRAVDVRARCVYMPGDAPSNADSVCLVPCSLAGADCSWVGPTYSWNTTATCQPLAGDSYCAPTWTSVGPHCRQDVGRTGTAP